MNPTSNELFLEAQYPALKKIPRHHLCNLPTPVHRLTQMEKILDVRRLYIKRDDIINPIYGGNKIRKLEFIIGKALQSGKKELITFGYAGSNFALAASIHAREKGIRNICFLLPQKTSETVRKNLLMNFQTGAELYHKKNILSLGISAFLIILYRLLKTGHIPQVSSPGGSSFRGTLGYINAGFELKSQIKSKEMKRPDIIYLPLGSMGTAAGLLIGLKASGIKSKIVGVRVVEKYFTNEKTFKIFFNKIMKKLRKKSQSFPMISFDNSDFYINHHFFGGGYGVMTSEADSAIRETLIKEKIYLEQTYTGKTMASLITDARKGKLKDKTVLFWNTFNSIDFGEKITNVNYKELKRKFHKYFIN
jgi:D-cysteine desulfhydrase